MRARAVLSVVACMAGLVVATVSPSPAKAAGEAYTPLAVPARVLDTRPGGSTVDGVSQRSGLVAARSTVSLVIGGRAGVPATAASVVLNVTVTGAEGDGFVTVYPCGAPQPNASNLNFVRGDTIPNSVFAKLGANASVCLYADAATHLLVDVAGYFPDETALVPLVAPARVLDT